FNDSLGAFSCIVLFNNSCIKPTIAINKKNFIAVFHSQHADAMSGFFFVENGELVCDVGSKKEVHCKKEKTKLFHHKLPPPYQFVVRSSQFVVIQAVAQTLTVYDFRATIYNGLLPYKAPHHIINFQL